MRSDGHCALLVHSLLQAGAGVGVGVGPGVLVGQTQLDSPVQLGFRHALSLQTILLGQSASLIQLVPHCGTGVGEGVGDGVGDGVAVGQTHVDSPVQLGLRQTPVLQTIVDGHCALVVHVVLHCGTGVGLGVGVGVGGGVPSTVNDIVHEVAPGCDSGAVGATGVCVDVRRVMTTTPTAPISKISATPTASSVFRFIVIFITNAPIQNRLVRHRHDTAPCKLLVARL